MRLSNLCSEAEVTGGCDVNISSITSDSRHVAPGALFAALPGTRDDGSRYVAEAITRGAVAVLASQPLADAVDRDIPLIVDPQPHRRLAKIAAAFHAPQPRFVAAVTGTNGKTSVASFTRQLWRLVGLPAASLGTLGLEMNGEHRPGTLTTPEPTELHRIVSQVAGRGIDRLVIEASSHGLHQYRVDGLTISAAAFTNITRDHYDYHSDYREYFAAKARLFLELLASDGLAVLNADTPDIEGLRGDLEARGIEIIDVGRSAGRYRLTGTRATENGQDLTIDIDGRAHHIHSPLIGQFQGINLLMALALAVAGGAGHEEALQALPRVVGAPGRMQHIVDHPSGAGAYVDYAHTPDALAHALDAIRPHARGKVAVVFGCGGDRDPGKRALMGAIADRLADRLYVTDDNPRSEAPAPIRHAIIEGASSSRVREIADRREAIFEAFSELQSGDVLIVAGKGHETGQIVGDKVLPFDDAAVLREARTSLGDIGMVP